MNFKVILQAIPQIGILLGTVSPALAENPLQSNQWQAIVSEPPCTVRHEAALTALDGKLYLLGGRGIKRVEVFDPATKAWKKLAHPPIELHHFREVVRWLQGSDVSPPYLAASKPEWQTEFFYEHPTIKNTNFIPSCQNEEAFRDTQNCRPLSGIDRILLR